MSVDGVSLGVTCQTIQEMLKDLETDERAPTMEELKKADKWCTRASLGHTVQNLEKQTTIRDKSQAFLKSLQQEQRSRTWGSHSHLNKHKDGYGDLPKELCDLDVSQVPGRKLFDHTGYGSSEIVSGIVENWPSDGIHSPDASENDQETAPKSGDTSTGVSRQSHRSALGK